jgi:hypothetical protein
MPLGGGAAAELAVAVKSPGQAGPVSRGAQGGAWRWVRSTRSTAAGQQSRQYNDTYQNLKKAGRGTADFGLD